MNGKKEFVSGLDASGMKAFYNVLLKKISSIASNNPDIIDQLKRLRSFVKSVNNSNS